MRKAIGIGGFGAIAIVAMFLMSAAPTVGACEIGYSTEAVLYVGQKEIGANVEVTHDAGNFYVTYTMPDCWLISETHVAISLNGPDDIPQTKKNNPIPGQFEYSENHNPMVDEYTYTIPFPEDFEWGDCVCFATHAVVNKVVDNQVVEQQTGWAGDHDFKGKNWAVFFCYQPAKVLKLPSTVSAYIANPVSTSYWGVTVKSGGSGDLPNDGYFLGWCIDQTVTINQNHEYSFTVIPWYDNDALNGIGEGISVNDWHRINYILNHKDSYSTTVVQNAIWYFTKDLTYSEITAIGGNTKILVDDAIANGGNFEASSGEYIAVVLQYGTSQTIIIEVDP